MIDSPLKRTICGIDELPAHRMAGVTHVLSILDPETDEPGHFGDYPHHERLTLRFHDIIAPLPGMVVPDPEHVEALLDFGRGVAADARAHLLVHCHMGVSRSTAAMAALLLQAHPEADEDAVFDRIVRIRPQAWPNSRVVGFVDAQLGRRGRMTAALRHLYARQLRAEPMLAEVMRGFGRDAEVEMGLTLARSLD